MNLVPEEEFMYIKDKRGQSTVEYVLLMTAVVAVIIAMVTAKDSGLQKQLNTTLNTAIGDVGTLGDALTGSHQGSAPGAIKNPVVLNVTP
jgi:Flp pilus assembly pilin Flp